jgi:hypothetical protein
MTRPVLAFAPCATADDRRELVAMVRRYYPGLLEAGEMSWTTLQMARKWNTGAIGLDVSKYIIDKYNQVEGNDKLSSNVNRWPSHTEALQEYDTSDPDPETIAEPREERGRQVLIAPWDVGSVDGVNEQEHIVFMIDGDSSNINGTYNLVLNMAMITYAVETNTECRYPLRVLLREGWEQSVITKDFEPGIKSVLCATLLVRYNISDEERALGKYGVPPPADAEYSYIVLFVYKQGIESQDEDIARSKFYSPFTLVNASGKRVEWGEYNDRKRITYYELRNIMAHLGPHSQYLNIADRLGAHMEPEFTQAYRRTNKVLNERRADERWTMLSINSTADRKVRQYLIRKRMADDTEEANEVRADMARGLTPVCIDWIYESPGFKDKKKKGRFQGLRFTKSGDKKHNKQCKYEGIADDFDRQDFSLMDHQNGTEFQPQEGGADETMTGTVVSVENLVEPPLDPRLLGKDANRSYKIQSTWNKILSSEQLNPLVLLNSVPGLDPAAPAPVVAKYTLPHLRTASSPGSRRGGGGGVTGRLLTLCWASAVIAVSALCPLRAP